MGAIAVVKKIKLKFDNMVPEQIRQAKEAIVDYLKDTLLDYAHNAASPVDGEPAKFAALDPDYIKVKRRTSGSTKPNMEEHGDMLDELDVRFDGDTLTSGWHDDASEKSKLKADNHNKFTDKSLKTPVPKRRLIPLANQNFRPTIMRDIQDIIDAYRDEDAD